MRPMMPPMPPGPDSPARAATAPLLALIVGQVGLHACMAGVRMAAPLLALRDGQSALAVGVLLALFAAAPFALALPAGRFADRHGYHRPMRWAVGFTVAGAALALTAALLPGVPFALLCASAVLSGAGANVGLIAIQRTAGRGAADPAQRAPAWRSTPRASSRRSACCRCCRCWRGGRRAACLTRCRSAAGARRRARPGRCCARRRCAGCCS